MELRCNFSKITLVQVGKLFRGSLHPFCELYVSVQEPAVFLYAPVKFIPLANDGPVPAAEQEDEGEVYSSNNRTDDQPALCSC